MQYVLNPPYVATWNKMRGKITKSLQPKIEPTNPWFHDEFEREEHGKRLTRIVERTPGSFVIAVKAPFGSGKSVFLSRWGAHLEYTAKIPVVHVDAWKSDYLIDPLEALIIAVAQRMESASEMSVIEDWVDKAINFSLNLIPTVARIGAAVATSGGSEVVTISADTLAKSGKKLLSAAREREKSMVGFSSSLQEAKSILVRKLGAAKERPLVFILDELDRCRPDFAVKMLERIKHFFDVPGIVFVIAMDGQNLPAAVQCVFGQSVDGERYLRKFFDLEFYLPTPTIDQTIITFFIENELVKSKSTTIGQELEKGYKNWLDGKNLDNSDFESPEVPQFFVAFKALAQPLGLSLRDLIQALTIVVAVIRSAKIGEPLFAIPLTLIICLRFRSPERFQAILQGNKNLGDFFYSHSSVPEPDKEPVAKLLGESSNLLVLIKTYINYGTHPRSEIKRTLDEIRPNPSADGVALEQIKSLRALGREAEKLTSSSSINDHLWKLMNIAGTFINTDELPQYTQAREF